MPAATDTGFPPSLSCINSAIKRFGQSAVKVAGLQLESKSGRALRGRIGQPRVSARLETGARLS